MGTCSVAMVTYPTTHVRLFELIRSWGGDVESCSREQWSKLMEENRKTAGPIAFCPFNSWCGVNYETKTLHLDQTQVPDIGTLIHETGHIFASPSEPWCSNEFQFFGWEYAMAKRLKCVLDWEKSTGAYGIDQTIGGTYFDEFCELADHPDIKARFLVEKLDEAWERGLIVGMEPVSIR